MQQQQVRTRINNQIRAVELRVIDQDGNNLGIISLSEALSLAKSANLDLVEINAKSTPPTAKIVDYGKLKYDEKKQQQVNKKNQKTQELKELSFTVRTEEHDLQHKAEKAKQFLLDGNKTKITCTFKGREIAVSTGIAKEKLDWFFEQLKDVAQDEHQIRMEAKSMSSILLPLKK